MKKGRFRDLVIYGSTPGGIACALRAAREGLSVALVSPHPHLGGLLASGLSTMDTLYNGSRAPLYEELRSKLHDAYAERHGRDSEAYRRSLPGQPKVKFEAHVAEAVLTRMLDEEPGIEVCRSFLPVKVERGGRKIESVEFLSRTHGEVLTLTSPVVVDASYEGDLAVSAGIAYRVGRESREAHGEEHAGRIFMAQPVWPVPQEKVDAAQVDRFRRLNLFHYERWYERLDEAGSGQADASVQAYNLRTMITCDPENRIPVAKPAGYDRQELLDRMSRDIVWRTWPPSPFLPGRKAYLNCPEIVGIQHTYPDGDWAERDRIREEYARLTLCLIYFMQHDDSVSGELRMKWREWGLPRDEFADNGHLPYEIYARETRRFEGRSLFTEHDARWASGLERAPIHDDAISITEWFLDSHPCTPGHIPGSMWEGELLLNYVTVPGQISLGTLLPPCTDNLLIPVCLSSTHVGWGALRLEPTWMSVGEAAGHLAVMAVRASTEPAAVPAADLTRRLAEGRVMVSFFNDLEGMETADWYPGIQFLGTKGFFGTYDARPLDVLEVPLAKAWIAEAAKLADGLNVDPNDRARSVWSAERESGPSLTIREFLVLLAKGFEGTSRPVDPEERLKTLSLAAGLRLSRATACRILYQTLFGNPSGGG